MNSTHEPYEFDSEAILTAYVLGELSDEDAKKIERRCAEDETLRAEIESIRETTVALTEALAEEPSPGLTDEQREAVVRGARADEPDPPLIYSFVRHRTAWGAVGLAAAACVVVALFVPTVNRARRESQIAITMTAPEESGESATFKQAEGRAGGARGAETGRAFRVDQAAPVARPPRSTLAPPPPSDPAEYHTGGGSVRADVARDVTFADAGQAAPPAPARYRADSLRKSGVVAEGVALGAPPATQAPDIASDGAARSASASRFLTDQEPATPFEETEWYRAVIVEGAEPNLATASQEEIKERLIEVARAKNRLSRDADPELMNELDDEFKQLIARRRQDTQWNREAYAPLVDNAFKRPTDEALSTFSIDVDTASYANVRRFIESGQLPPKDAVRLEEMINYFDYAYEPPTGEDPFSVNVETSGCPWNAAHRLVRIGLKGRTVPQDMRPATSLVFLLDVSGSMNRPNKLGLVKQSMRMLVENLTGDDRVAIVVYAGASGLVLPSTFCDEKEQIVGALDRLRAGGSTNGGAGIELAYKVAGESFIEGGVNRVILCTDGDFNVGVSSRGDLENLIEQKRKTGVFLSLLGFGTGNWQDERMETLSNKGNGNFAYIDDLDEARKVLVEEMAGTLVTIAKDVKIQVEFNPAKVGAYRLIGYANRILAAEDFNDDTKDAGEIGAGHTVTALYEIAPPGAAATTATPAIDDLKYQRKADDRETVSSDEMLTVKLRYKQPDGDVSALIEHPVIDDGSDLETATEDFQFAAAVAGFGMVLRDSEHKGSATFSSVLDLAGAGTGADPKGYRAEFTRLVETARTIAGE